MCVWSHVGLSSICVKQLALTSSGNLLAWSHPSLVLFQHISGKLNSPIRGRICDPEISSSCLKKAASSSSPWLNGHQQTFIRLSPLLITHRYPDPQPSLLPSPLRSFISQSCSVTYKHPYHSTPVVWAIPTRPSYSNTVVVPLHQPHWGGTTWAPMPLASTPESM